MQGIIMFSVQKAKKSSGNGIICTSQSSISSDKGRVC